MKQRAGLFRRELYAVLAILIVFLMELIYSSYPGSTSFLTGRYMLSAVGPLFTFCAVTFLSLLLLGCAAGRKEHPWVLRTVLALAAALLWAGLCRLMPEETVLLGGRSAYFAWPAALYALVLTALQERKEKE